MPPINPSGPAEILRATQKDDEFCERINQQLLAFLLKFKGHIFISKNKQFIFQTSQTLYYALTTLSKLQTLGEEYTRIVQVGKTGKHVPGILQSMSMVFVHVFGEHIIVQTLNYFIDYIRDNKAITIHAKDQIIRSIMTVKSLVPLFQSLNRVLFYWNGAFYTWAKRFFNISYIYAVPWYHPKRPLHVFKILSILTAIHSSILILMALFKKQNVPNNMKEYTDNPISSNSSKCPLCLEPRQNTSLSFCGHLFCWYCIHEWLQTNNICPICNKTLYPRNIIALQNCT